MQRPEMPELITREVYDHEILLAFNDDDDAVAFREWLQEEGFGLFEAAARSRAVTPL